MKDQILDFCIVDNNEKDLFIGDEFDNCLLGVCSSFGDFTPAYDLDKIISVLVKKHKITEDEAIKRFNIDILENHSNLVFIKLSDEIESDLSVYNNSMLFLDGYGSSCMIGVCIRQGCEIVAAYSDSDCVEWLIENDDMTEEDAIEFFEYNTRGSYIGEHTPVFVTLL